jgi:ABC-type transporter Mla subunit MlaD
MKIKIESFTNPITEDVLQKKDFQYPSGASQVNLPPEVINLLNNINQSLQQLLTIFDLGHIGGDIKQIKENLQNLINNLNSSIGNINQQLANINMLVSSINNYIRNQH